MRIKILDKSKLTNAAFALFSSCLEYYNYMLLMYLIPVWGKEFFAPGQDIFLKGFGIIFLTALTRPIAANIIGKIGDKFGRKRALLICAIIMSTACITIAVLPTYSSIEWIARYGILTFVVIACRILQIASVAGKLNGSAIFLIEHFPDRAGLISAVIWFTTILGMFIASVTEYACIKSGWFSWRVAIGIGGLMSFCTVFLAKFVQEGKEYKKASEDENPSAEAKLTVWPYIATLCIACGISGMFYYSTSYIPVLYQIKYSLTNMGLYRGLFLGIYGFSALLGGICIDRFERNSYSRNSQVLVGALCVVILYLLTFVHGFADQKILLNPIVKPIFGSFIGRFGFVSCITAIVAYLTGLSARLRWFYVAFFVGWMFWSREVWQFLFIFPTIISWTFPKDQDKSITTNLVMGFGAGLSLLLAIPVLNTLLYSQSLVMQAISLIFTGFFVGPSHKILNNLFPPNKRYQSISMLYAIGTAVVGGSSTFVCLKLEKMNPLLPGLFMILSAAAGIFGVYAAFLSKSKKNPND